MMVLFVLEIIWIQAQDARDCFEDYERALQHKMDENTEEESRTEKRKLKNTEIGSDSLTKSSASSMSQSA